MMKERRKAGLLQTLEGREFDLQNRLHREGAYLHQHRISGHFSIAEMKKFESVLTLWKQYDPPGIHEHPVH